MNTKRVFTKKEMALIDKHRDRNVDIDDWHEFIIDDFKEVAGNFGIDIKDVDFSGFWSQGDGAMWISDGSFSLGSILRKGFESTTGTETPYGCDPTKFTGAVKAFHDLYAEIYREVGVALLSRSLMQVLDCYSIHVTRSGHHYSHSGCMQVDTECEVDEDDQEIGDTPFEFLVRADKLHESMQAALRCTADELYITLEEEHGYLTSDEAVWDSLEADEITVEEDEEDEPLDKVA